MTRVLLFSLLLLLPHFPMPNAQLTPGDVLTRDISKVCTRGYAKSVRNVPEREKRIAYAKYGINTHQPGQYEVDHLISLELGGSNAQKNLWPEPYPSAWSKDSLENVLHRAVCARRIPIDSAQRWIAHNWMGAYRAMKRGQL